jgi:anti-sigma regulatory factor (Ser/Thr protein kinase)
LQVQLLPDFHAPAAARHALRTLPLGERADDVVLVASELVTNAVLHADTSRPIELIAECRPDGARVEVRDHGHGFEPEHVTAGAGFHIAASASARWGIDQDVATSVWFEV